MIRIPGEGTLNHTIGVESTRPGLFTRLFRALFAKISSIFEGVFGKKPSSQEEGSVRELASRKFELLNLKADIVSQKEMHEQVLSYLVANPDAKVGNEFLDYREKLPERVQDQINKFMMAKMRVHKYLGNITNRELTPFFHEITRIAKGG